jgi:hypothetical protein
MLGDHFYHQRIRKAVAVFGSLFNNIRVVRKASDGSTLSQVKVPLSYAPKRDFLARIDAMNNGEDAERQIALKLPRMSFEIVALTYDAARQLPKMNNCISYPTNWSGGGTKLYTPVPYTVAFQLNIMAKTQDDSLQIVEQIMPFFTPHYTVTVKPLDGFDIKEDTPITMTGVTFSDDFEAPLESRRTIIYTLDFEMKINLYKGVSTNTAIISEACVQFLSMDGSELFSKVCTDSAFAATPLSGLAVEDGLATGVPFIIKNVPSAVTSITATSPLHGTATASLGSSMTMVDGVIQSNGTWYYYPADDYNGLDSFNILVGGDWGIRTYPIAIDVEGSVDTVGDNIVCSINSFVDFNVATNDNWSSNDLTFVVSAGGDPSNGTVTILDGSTGLFRYTPNAAFTGTDTFFYRVSPLGGSSEVGEVVITIS